MTKKLILCANVRIPMNENGTHEQKMNVFSVQIGPHDYRFEKIL